ncbi:MAG: hypothetical protein ACI8Q1_003031 [Parvicella sp.]|jgi:hypothetical protein
MKTSQSIFYFSLILIIQSCSLHVMRVSDLRTELAKVQSDESKAKALIIEMGAAHRIDNWKLMDTYSVSFSDVFYGFMGKQAHNYKEDSVAFRLSYIPGTFDGRLDFLSGKANGNTWGIQSWNSYEMEAESSTANFKKNKDITFWLPTYQYFIEFPLRIQSATAFAYAGEQEIDGQACDGVVASWNTVEPQKKIDQYVIWISKKTKRIVKLEYTIREAYKFLTGAVYYNNYKEYNGIILPSELPVLTNLVKEGYLHKMRIHNFKADSLTIKDLRPNTDLKTMGDEK